MVWNKEKIILENFMCEALVGRVEYRPSSYRYRSDKSGQSYISVDKKEVFSMKSTNQEIKWYMTEMEIKNDPDLDLPIYPEDIARIAENSNGNIPEDRLEIMARNHKLATYAKEVYQAQMNLAKSDFFAITHEFLSSPIDKSLSSNNILLNILAIMDKRIEKKRLLDMRESIKLKHPAVLYFYKLRMGK